MVSLADLRARSITPLWQEAVAVVQELIQTVKATTGSAELLPDLEHVALIPNGDVVALPGSPEPAQPVRHAAVMLKLLLEGTPTPPELEVFVERNVADPPQYDSVAEFSRNLAFFERPGRRSDVERLVGRAVAAEQTSRADEELRRLKDRASEVTVSMQAPEFLQQQQEKKVKTVPIPLVAAAGVVVLAAVLWAWQWASAPQSPAPVDAAAGEPAAAATPEDGPDGVVASAPTPEPAAEAAASVAPGADASSAAVTEPTAPAAEPPKSLLARAGDAVRTAVNTLIGSDSRPVAAAGPSVAEEPRMAAPPRRATRRVRTPEAASAPAAEAAPAPAPAPTPAPVAPAAAAPPPSPMPEFIDRSLEEPVEVFTAADPSVTPAIIIRPVLPKEPPPDVPPDEVGTIEVTVDEYGDVLHVKLISPANRYRERMLVSAAKTWKFRPAYKDGRPVRYKTRVRLTI